jgi:hypothetical protein
MTIKETLTELCQQCENMMNDHDLIMKTGRTHTVVLFSGLKRESYHVPQIVTTKMALSGEADKVRMAWYAEISVDNQFVFRECYSCEDESKLPSKENDLLEKLLYAVFMYGINSANHQILKLLNRPIH